MVISASAGAYPPGPERHGESDALWVENRYGALIGEWESVARSDAFPVVRLRIPPVYGPSVTGGLGAVFLPGLLLVLLPKGRQRAELGRQAAAARQGGLTLRRLELRPW